MAPPRGPRKPRTIGNGPVGGQVPADTTPLPEPTPLTAPQMLEGNEMQAAAEKMVAANEGTGLSEAEAFMAMAEAPRPERQRPEEILAEMNETRRRVELQKNRLLVKDLELRKAHEEQVREALRLKKPIPPVKTLFRSVGVDRSVPVDYDGSSAVPPGMHTRWVAMRDQAGNMSDNRTQDMIAAGYDFVKSKAKGHEGKPITNMGLILMACDPDAEAERVGALQRELAHSEEEEKKQLYLLQEEARRRSRGNARVSLFAPTEGEWANEKGTYEVPVLDDMPELAGLNV